MHTGIELKLFRSVYYTGLSTGWAECRYQLGLEVLTALRPVATPYRSIYDRLSVSQRNSWASILSASKWAEPQNGRMLRMGSYPVVTAYWYLFTFTYFQDVFRTARCF